MSMGKWIQFGGAMFSNWSNCELRHSCKWNPRHSAVTDVHNKKSSEFQRDLYLLMTTNLVINQVFQKVLKWAILKGFPGSGSDSCYFRSDQSKLTPAFLRANFRSFSHSLSSVIFSTNYLCVIKYDLMRGFFSNLFFKKNKMRAFPEIGSFTAGNKNKLELRPPNLQEKKFLQEKYYERCQAEGQSLLSFRLKHLCYEVKMNKVITSTAL